MLQPKETPSQRWSSEEKNCGETILDFIYTNIDTKVVAEKHAQATIAGRTLGLITVMQTFKDFPPKIRTYLEFSWKLESKQSDTHINDSLDIARGEFERLYEDNSDEYTRRFNLDGSPESDAPLPKTIH